MHAEQPQSIARKGRQQSGECHSPDDLLTDINERPAFNEVYLRFFKKPFPVRCAVGVAGLATPEMRVEVTAMAVRNQ
ncbi:RidA family protein [Brucella anthropi]|uniref:RidA family protein n=1 Tax=Brucella anthropi TaxID=529 RepID=UPI00272E24B6|nr:RidA family protein [Brucella anthropi]